jgi:methionyl-tRNA formyltransferase
VRPSLAADGSPARDLPVFEAGRLDHPDAERLCWELAPDLAVVACYPHRLPASWLAAPSLGCWNIHPSLLPAYRGPVPVFWQLRAGEIDTGVTVHRMDAGFDTGPVLARRPVAFPEGARAADLDVLLAETGAALVPGLLAGGGLPQTPQDEARATRQGFPQEGDLQVPVTWPARRAFDFMRGSQAWGPFQVSAASRTLVVAEAVSWDAAACATPVAITGGHAVIAFSPGSVRVRLAEERPSGR